VGENRSLVSHGLRKLNDSPRPGFRGLLECAGIRRTNLSTSQIVFGIAPRINAAGRLGDARRAVEMLIEEDEVRAFQRAQELETDNRNRRAIDEETFAEAQVIAERMVAEGPCRTLVIYNPDWHPGVIGIVASRIVERFYLPTVLLTSVDGIAKGSARSIAGFDIYKALKRCESHIEQFGGHKYAAGLSIRAENIESLRQTLNEFASERITDDMLIPELFIDAEVTLEEVDNRFFGVIKQFAPFGPGNARPLFLLRNAQIVGYPRIVGKDHLKFRVRSAHGYFEAIGFGMGSRLRELNGQSRYDIVMNVEENEYRGNITPQLRIMDFRAADAKATYLRVDAVTAASNGNGTEPVIAEPVKVNGVTSVTA
jgi:single-stranded-DNA-specific exonuclease